MKKPRSRDEPSDSSVGMRGFMASRTGIEPVSTAPETVTLSIRPPGHTAELLYINAPDNAMMNRSSSGYWSGYWPSNHAELFANGLESLSRQVLHEAQMMFMRYRRAGIAQMPLPGCLHCRRSSMAPRRIQTNRHEDESLSPADRG